MSLTRGPQSEEQQQDDRTQLQWLMEVVRRFGTPPLAYSLDDAAPLLGIGRTKLDRLISLGLIRVIHYEPGDHPKITRGEMERFLEEREKEASPVTHGAPATAKRPSRTYGAALSAVDADVAQLRAGLKKRRR